MPVMLIGASISSTPHSCAGRAQSVVAGQLSEHRQIAAVAHADHRHQQSVAHPLGRISEQRLGTLSKPRILPTGPVSPRKQRSSGLISSAEPSMALNRLTLRSFFFLARARI